MQLMRDFRFAGIALTCSLFLSACATTSGETASPPAAQTAGPRADSPSMSEAALATSLPTNTASPARAAACDMFVSPGVLRRSSLVRVIDAGLPRWMQGVQGDRALSNHRFQGWLIKSMYPGDPCYQAIELRGGDIVQKVNGKSIERPEQAFDVAQSLRTASALVIDFLRDGKARKMTLSIAD